MQMKMVGSDRLRFGSGGAGGGLLLLLLPLLDVLLLLQQRDRRLGERVLAPGRERAGRRSGVLGLPGRSLGSGRTTARTAVTATSTNTVDTHDEVFMNRYALNPAVSFLPVSPNEVTAQGSPLDGFVLSLRDETHRGLARAVVHALRDPLTIEDLHAAVADSGVEQEELGEYLQTLVASGAVLRFDHAHGHSDDVLAFKRFGTIPVPDAFHELVFVGGALAEALAARLRDHGLAATSVAEPDLAPLERFQGAEQRAEDAAASTEDHHMVGREDRGGHGGRQRAM